ncbi:iron uptake porin [Cyanobium sp. Morenito 9A2]|uniref:iron uptake porin n=1 Tax=Cyanobium sp. Morenito 9A2 TaxID=2823718 RepID=UPI0020CC32F1|nr:iron uptake porin [Cyanobium sp. Morenito 9A2]MCP9848358.1 iron uptake porin [Cyanobium sp. Morenito 9A2]
MAVAVTTSGAAAKAEPLAAATLADGLERHGCGGAIRERPLENPARLSRLEAAAQLQSCLERSPTLMEGPLHQREAVAPELRQWQGWTRTLEKRLAQLETTAFSPTTTLSGVSTFVLGGTAYGGDVAANLPGTSPANSPRDAISFNYELRLVLNTSFTGKDLLFSRLRSGNFNASAFDGTPVRLSKIDAAYSPTVTGAGGLAVAAANGMRLDRLSYRFPVGRELAVLVGPLSRNHDTLAIVPSVYGARGGALLEFFTFYGAPAVYNKATGATLAAIWRQEVPRGRGRWGASVSYVAQRGGFGNPSAGGLFNGNSGANLTAQVGYQAPQWALAAAFRSGQAGTRANVGTTLGSAILAAGDGGTAGSSLNLALSGYWQPQRSGWLPSISAGWGSSWIRQNADAFPTPQPLNALTNVRASRSWSVALEWKDALAQGYTLGAAVGQPTQATGLRSGRPADGNFAFELWYALPMSDRITVTPAVFYLNRPFGQLTRNAAGAQNAGGRFSDLGVLLQTTIRF